MGFQGVIAKKAAEITVFRFCRKTLFLGVVLAVSGCASTTIEDAVPQSALSSAATGEQGTKQAAGQVTDDQQLAGVQHDTADTAAAAAALPGTTAVAQDTAAESGTGGNAIRGTAVTADNQGQPAAGQMALGADGFPDLNVTPKPSMRQISNAEKSKALSDLKQAQQSQKDAGTKNYDDEVKRLRHLAETNGENVLREIEGN